MGLKVKQKAKYGFTLAEIVLALAIASIIMMGTLSMSGMIFKGFSESSKEYDLQTDVRNTIQSIYNVLKEAKQVHLVGATVYTGNKDDYNKLDENYNFIGLNKDAVKGDKMVNLSYSPTKSAWYDFPLTSGEKVIDIKNSGAYQGRIKYDISFYKNDLEPVKKMQKNILSVTVKASLYVGEGANEKLEKEYELTQDIELSNANQILISKYLVGGMDKVTGLAYKNMDIKAGTKNSTVANIVFVVDKSGSMGYDMNGKPTGVDGNKRKTIAINAINGASKPGFLDKIKSDIVDGQDGNVNIYIISYDFMVNQYYEPKEVKKYKEVSERIYNRTSPDLRRNFNVGSTPYYTIHDPLTTNGWFYSSDFTKERSRFQINKINELGKAVEPKIYIGPYTLKDSDSTMTLQDAKNWVSGSKILGSPGGGTNTAEGILAGINILGQADYIAKNPTAGKKTQESKNYFILISDGEPTYYSESWYFNSGWLGYFTNNDSYGMAGDRDNHIEAPNAGAYSAIRQATYYPMIGYEKWGTEFEKNTQFKELIDKVFLIGFSNVDADKKTMGMNNEYFYKTTTGGLKYLTILGAFKSGRTVKGGSVKNNIEYRDALNYKFLEHNNDNVKGYDANSSDALVNALSDIATTIAIDMAVYDGPEEMK